MQLTKESYLSVPYGMSVHGQEEIDAVVNCLKSSTQMGKNVREMERKVSRLFDKKFGIMLNSGSSANYLAVEILDLPENSEVITPALTFSTTVAPLVRNNLVPAFVDVEPGTYNIDAKKVERAISKKTKAIMLPNLLGNLPDWKHIREIADKYDLFVIEDSCDTLGAKVDGVSTGSFSEMSTTSFYGSHVINCAGNGGMLCINDSEMYTRSKLLRSWGRSSSLFVESESIENRFNVELDSIQYDAKFVFEALGYNWEPSEVGAAFGLAQLSKLDENIKLRNYWFNKQVDFFKKYSDWFILPKQLHKSFTGWLAFPVTLKECAPFTRTEMQIYLEKRGIMTRTIFTGNILRQPGFRGIKHRVDSDGYQYTDQVMSGGILLGCHHGMTEIMMAHTHNVVSEFLSGY
ncbi:MAG: aminotransferase class I/II-fold pyridoxal phosphate-dependent enzyme [Coxiellaceae bacterium]|nr:aminotransferase class I/II-fold pyridoxal phosphate-dependent enzyme [Coxiellaceae bacterium]